MRIGIATDHNGAEQKADLIFFLGTLNCETYDFSKDNNPTDDYPDFAIRVANAVASHEIDLGILLCGTGIGMSIAANKVKGIRAAKVSTNDEARLAREHNDANIICLSYKENMDKLKEMIEIFINTPFSNAERHVRRINKISELENDR